MSEARTRQDTLAEARRAAADEIADAYLSAFSTPAGQRVLLDLEARVMTPVLPPDCSEAELRDLNGMKRLFGTIMERIGHGRRNRSGAGRAGVLNATGGPYARGANIG